MENACVPVWKWVSCCVWIKTFCVLSSDYTAEDWEQSLRQRLQRQRWQWTAPHGKASRVRTGLCLGEFLDAALLCVGQLIRIFMAQIWPTPGMFDTLILPTNGINWWHVGVIQNSCDAACHRISYFRFRLQCMFHQMLSAFFSHWTTVTLKNVERFFYIQYISHVLCGSKIWGPVWLFNSLSFKTKMCFLMRAQLGLSKERKNV